MMTSRLRDALGAVAMAVIVVGPIVGILMVIMALGEAPRMRGGEFGRTIGMAFELIVGALIAGGVLRTLVSIDARLEEKG